MDLSSRPTSRISSRRHSVTSELGYNKLGGGSDARNIGTATYSSNAGIAKYLNERGTAGVHLSICPSFSKVLPSSVMRSTTGRATNSNYSTRDTSPFVSNEMASSIVSLTPSVISSPTGSKSFSPTGTPLNSPLNTPPGTPPNEPNHSSTLKRREEISPVDNSSSEGYIYAFFSSLKGALYGEQTKEAKTLIRKKRKEVKQKHYKRLGILEKVEEVGIENLFSSDAPSDSSSSTLGSSSNYYLSGSKTYKNLKFYASDECDSKDVSWNQELEDIAPGSLTVGTRDGNGTPSPPDQTIGQLTAPSFSMFGRPILSPGELGKVPCSPSEDNYPYNKSHKALGGGVTIGGRGPGRTISPGEKRPLVPGKLLGIPGHPGTADLASSLVRPDLGYVPNSSAPHEQSDFELESKLTTSYQQQYPFEDGTGDGGFIGNIRSVFFGRKGGFL